MAAKAESIVPPPAPKTKLSPINSIVSSVAKIIIVAAADDEHEVAFLWMNNEAAIWRLWIETGRTKNDG